MPFILGVREEERKGSDLDSMDFLGETKIKRFQNESLLEKEGSQTISGTIGIGRQEHAYMETHSALVIPGIRFSSHSLIFGGQGSILPNFDFFFFLIFAFKLGHFKVQTIFLMLQTLKLNNKKREKSSKKKVWKD